MPSIMMMEVTIAKAKQDEKSTILKEIYNYKKSLLNEYRRINQHRLQLLLFQMSKILALENLIHI